MARSRSSARWLNEHFSDEYVKRAHALGYRSRAVFKLAELDERERLFKPGLTVVDLGAAPGGWSQYAAERVGKSGRIIALDILPMEAIPGVTFIQGDFRDEAVLARLAAELAGRPVDVLLSDMAPNATGNRLVDQPRAMYLAELALDTAKDLVRPGGAMVVKLFQGPDFDALVKNARRLFGRVAVRKPQASRDRSREVYLVAKAAGG
ncbi:23S rRNA 2'-O-ribose U2552 methyltransferase [Candidatus Methylocalor cossyra]|uniref:Ribosomal RNA large subunit methyltransferase E n=2 Tax=Candidatus Methylocalor cossyra TaxID=3108543 RepID=A0ABP1C4R8_9GAMM